MTAATTESSQEDLAIQRHLFDLVLQPAGQWDGFTLVEQYALSALRYQLNYTCYALCMAQLTRTPAFTGYLAEAQRNSIQRMRDPKVWRYWATENLLGYLRWNPDPIVFGNVMYTGFFAAMLGMYESTNNDKQFSAQGALTLQGQHGTYVYDYPSLCERIVWNMNHSKYVQYPCEPHLIYPMCNAIALNGLAMRDRLHSTDNLGDLVDRVEASYSTFKFVRGQRFISGRGPMGVALPPTVGNDSIMAFWLHPLMPHRAERLWHLLRREFITLADGEAELKASRFENIDVGSYTKGDAFSRAAALIAAREFGDTEAADALEASLDRRAEIVRANGARRYKRASTWSNAAFALGKFTRAAALTDLVHGRLPTACTQGPLLAEAAYPEVLVAHADNDGAALSLVLYPGNGPVRTTLGLGRLEPHRTYQVAGATGATITASRDGTALVAVDLDGRTPLTIYPFIEPSSVT